MKNRQTNLSISLIVFSFVSVNLLVYYFLFPVSSSSKSPELEQKIRVLQQTLDKLERSQLEVKHQLEITLMKEEETKKHIEGNFELAQTKINDVRKELLTKLTSRTAEEIKNQKSSIEEEIVKPEHQSSVQTREIERQIRDIQQKLILFDAYVNKRARAERAGGLWKPFPRPLLSNRWKHTMVYSTPHVYIVGGELTDGQDTVSAVDILQVDIKAFEMSKWSSLPSPLPLPLSSAASISSVSFIQDGHLYFAGEQRFENQGKTEVQNSLIIYHPAEKNWEIRSIGSKIVRKGSSAVLLRGLIYIMGGTDLRGRAVHAIERYASRNNYWEVFHEAAPPSVTEGQRTEYCVTTYQQSTIFFIGGMINNQTTGLVESFDVVTKKWKSHPSMKIARKHFSCVQMKNVLYVIGGENEDGDLVPEMEEFDVELNNWTIKSSLVYPCRFCSSVNVANKFILTTGGSKEDRKSVQYFDPSSLADELTE